MFILPPQISWPRPASRKPIIMGASCAVMTALLACAPIQTQNIKSAAYESPHKANKYKANKDKSGKYKSGKYTAQPPYKRYGFNGHDLGDYRFDNTQTHFENSQNILKFAEADKTQPSPYVAPRRGAHRFAPPSLDVNGDYPALDHNAPPALRPQFQHHLGGPRLHKNLTPENVSPEDLGSENLGSENLAPKNLASENLAPDNLSNEITAFESTAERSSLNIEMPTIPAAPNPTPVAKALNSSQAINNAQTPNKLVINAAQRDAALKARRAGIGSFETAQPPKSKRLIPPLPEDQKNTIREEQAALAGIASKTALAGPQSLRQSLDSAFARSARLAAENLRVDEAEEVLKQAKAQSKPRLEFRSAIGPRQSETTFAFSNTTVSATNLRRSAELDLSLPIYQGGRLSAERSSARLGIESARAAVSQTRSQIIEETALAYLNVVRDRELAELYQQNVDLLKQQQSSVAELLALDESTISEKALIDARLAAQNIRLETGLGVLRESETHYKNLTGQAAPQYLPVPNFNLPFTLTEVQALAQQNNPELTALIHQAKSAEFQVDIAKSSNRPSLALQGILRGAEGQSETIDRNAAAELLLNLRVPITSGGEGQSRVRQAKIVRNRLNLEIRDTQDRLRDQIDSLWAQKIASEKNQAFNQTQIEATEFAVNIVAEQRAEGVATILNLLNVQQTLLDAKVQTVQARSRQDIANVRLLNFMGLYE